MGELPAPLIVVDDDGAQPRALDDGPMVAVECDADAQRARPVQELARECYRERELLMLIGRGGQAGFFAVSCPRMAPEGSALLWMFT